MRRALLTFVLLALAATVTPPAGAYELRINCGGLAYTTEGGKAYVADRAYTPGSGGYTTAGFLGDTWQTIGGTPDVPLCNTLRGNTAYRFDVPNGWYLVTLHICDFWSHGPRQNQYDVLIDGVQVISNLDCFARAGKNFTQIFRFAVEVTDGNIDVTFHVDLRHSYINAIAVESRDPDTVAPGPPADLVAYGSYERNSISWADSPEDDVAGYKVYRATSPAGPWNLQTSSPIQVSWYHNRTAAIGQNYYYGVVAVDAYGRQSSRAETGPVAAVPRSASTPPMYEIYMDQADFDALNSDAGVDSDDYFPGTFVCGSQVFQDIGVRYRGFVVRKLPKKSWKVAFNDNELFEGAARLNLNAEFTDVTLLREFLSYGLFDATSVPFSRNRYVNLMVNGDYFGIYNSVQQVDEIFLLEHGFDPDGNLYKCFSNLAVLPDSAAYVEAYEKKTNEDEGHGDLIAFIELLNSVDSETFFETFAPVLDVEGALEWYSVNVVLSNRDFTQKNYYIYHDLDEDYWTIIPWDVDFTFGKYDILDNLFDTDLFLLYGTNNRLISKMMAAPALRRKHLENLIRFARERFSPETMYPQIDALHAATHDDALIDWLKQGWDDNDDYLAGPDGLKGYVVGRNAYIESQVGAYITDVGLVINEFMARNASTITDEYGEFEDWIEVYNGHSDTLDLTGMFLTDDPLQTTRWEIPELLLPPGAHALFWADTDTLQGPFHTNFKLDGDGEWVGLFQTVEHGNVPIDFKSFGPQQIDVSIGRYPDGDLYWSAFGNPSPGDSIGGSPNLPPEITDTHHVPAWPGEEDSVFVIATILDEDGLTETMLCYDGGAGLDSLAMFDDGAHGDGESGDDAYGAVIPPFPNGTIVNYYVRATDTQSVSATDPPGAPETTHFYEVAYTVPLLRINELLADNETVNQDEAGQYDDWVEIYNAGASPMNLGGMFLTDDLADSTQWMFPDTTLAPGGFLLVWCDDDLGQGPLHANFKLGASGEEVGLYERAAYGGQKIDAIVFGQQMADVSYGRYPDGGTMMQFFPVPTPGASNVPGNVPPQITDTWLSPNPPEEDSPVQLTTEIVDDAPLSSTVAYYAIGGGALEWFTRILYDDGGHGDGQAGDHIYGALLPGQPDSTIVHFYVFAEDTAGVSTTDPPAGAADPYRYQVGYEPPALFINEILADNRATNPDEWGEYDDWIEIYNASADTVPLGGMFATDKLSTPRLWTFPDTALAPGGFLVVWTDGDVGQGPLHTNFRLDLDGEEIGLFDTHAYFFAVIDTFSFGPQDADTSYGRYPDGGESFVFMPTPTPGAANVAIAVEERVAVPMFALAPGLPNPFTTIAKIRYRLDREEPVQLRVYDVQGRLVRTLVDGPGKVGEHRVVWNGLDDRGCRASAGVYFVELRAGARQMAKKLVRLK